MSSMSAFQAMYASSATAQKTATYDSVMAKEKYTVELISRWSTVNGKAGKGLPSANTVTAIHVYDFDNTLFSSPLPNRKLWTSSSLGLLHRPDAFVNGGWWHDERILAATGEGVEVEEPRAWEGWWNETVVDLVKLSMMQKDALTVLLTGRGESRFAELIERIVRSKQLEFDMIVLKPQLGPESEEFENTLQFKCKFLCDLLSTYQLAKEIRIYEDRVKHVKSFEASLDQYRRDVEAADGRQLQVEVKQVAELTKYLDPNVEIKEVMSLVDEHNAIAEMRKISTRYMIKKKTNFTGYIIPQNDIPGLLAKFTLPQSTFSDKVNYMCRGIVIFPHGIRNNTDRARIDAAGGEGCSIEFEACSFGSWKDCVWAAWVRPVDPTVTVHTDGEAMVVLAVKGQGKPTDAKNIQTWTALENFPRFNTVIGELSYYDIVEKPAKQFKKDYGHGHGNHGSHGNHGNRHFGEGKQGRFAHHGGRGRGGMGRGKFRGRGGRVDR